MATAATTKTDAGKGTGAYVRKDSQFRKHVVDDPNAEHPVERDRYHLYVSYACPWAHRCLIVRHMKALQEVLPFTVVDWMLDFSTGWRFDKDGDPLTGVRYLKELYRMADAEYDGPVTVPVLWDRKRKTIVNNESSEILRMLNGPFSRLSANDRARSLDLYPKARRSEIDEINAYVYDNINNGVYRSGFAQTQEAYDKAVRALFDALETVEKRLSQKRYLIGNVMTEADVRLFTTLVRFDLVYVQHFKCNRKRLVDLPNLWAFCRELYQMDGVAATCDFEHIVQHYHRSHRSINPFGIVPINPLVDFMQPHERDRVEK